MFRLLFLLFITAAVCGCATNSTNALNVRTVVKSVSADRIEKDIKTLVDFGTRHTLSDTKSSVRGIGAARRWIEAEFEQISKACGGCLEVVVQGDIISGETRIPEPTEVVNVYAVQKGTTDSDRIIIMSGDIDSRITDPLNFTDDSPGANDNASGMAGTIEAARVLSTQKFPATIIYAGLSGEEQGLFGGKIMAAVAKKEGWNIEAVINNDMIGNSCGINGICDDASARVFSEGTRVVETEKEARTRRFQGGEVDSASRNVARYIDRIADLYIDDLDVMMIYRLDRFGRGGHHRPFNVEGYPAVRIMETNEHYDRQHQDLRNEDGRHYGDTIEYVDFDYAAKLTALNVATLAAMASAPAPPANVQISGQVSADTTLSWEQVNGAVAYKVYWRLTTDAQWSNFRNVGDVASYTLENIVIDNYYFGVASVSADGHESPVVFPGPAGAFND